MSIVRKRNSAKSLLKRGVIKAALILMLVVILPIAWIASTPHSAHNARAIEITEMKLSATYKLIEHFRKKYRRLPLNLAELRAFAHSINVNYTPYDGFGARLQYVPLTEIHYIVKSFGADSAEDTLTLAEDPSLLSLPSIDKELPIYRPPNDKNMRLYPAILLMGSKSPVSEFSARLYIDPQKKTRNLVVRSQKKKKHVMMAAHSGVEEFIWMPNGYELIYTATGSKIYQDGIYLWDIFSNETRNLMGDLDKKYSPISGGLEGKLHLSLSSISASGKNIFLFITQDDETPLDPTYFFSANCFYQIVLSSDVGKPSQFRSLAHQAQRSLFDVPQGLIQDIYLPFKGTENQLEWSNLPTTGEVEEVLNRWQDFSLNNAKSPLFPYSLWWLGSIYGEAATLLKASQPKDGATLSAYGAELTRAMALMETTPSYLRAIGAHIHHNLINATGLGYKIFEMQYTEPRNKPKKNPVIKKPLIKEPLQTNWQ